jgi:hypothetical protein
MVNRGLTKHDSINGIKTYLISDSPSYSVGYCVSLRRREVTVAPPVVGRHAAAERHSDSAGFAP